MEENGRDLVVNEEVEYKESGDTKQSSEGFFSRKVNGWKEGVSKKKKEELKQKSESSDEWAELRKYSRPYGALKDMPKEKRDNILMTLDVWSLPPEVKDDVRLSSREILDADRKGIAGRLHTRAEQLRPGFNLSWRKILTRILDEHARIHYSASLSEEELEYLVLQAFDNNNKYVVNQKSKGPLPKKMPGKSAYAVKANLVLDVVGALDSLYEVALSTEDKPAISAVFAIVKWIHVESPDADLMVEPIGSEEEL